MTLLVLKASLVLISALVFLGPALRINLSPLIIGLPLLIEVASLFFTLASLLVLSLALLIKSSTLFLFLSLRVPLPPLLVFPLTALLVQPLPIGLTLLILRLTTLLILRLSLLLFRVATLLLSSLFAALLSHRTLFATFVLGVRKANCARQRHDPERQKRRPTTNKSNFHDASSVELTGKNRTRGKWFRRSEGNCYSTNSDRQEDSASTQSRNTISSSNEPYRAHETAPSLTLEVCSLSFPARFAYIYGQAENQEATMQFFLDTANLDEIRKAAALGLADGVTTNPTLISKEGNVDFKQHIAEICKIVSGPVSAEVATADKDQMLKEGREYVKIAPNVVVKCPLTMDGLEATQILNGEGIKVNVTLCFSAAQAICAAKAGASFISPFLGRLDDIGDNGLRLLEEIIEIYDNYGWKTEVLAASLRHPIHVIEAARLGADIATMPYKVLEQLLKHPLTDKGQDQFLADWNKRAAKA